MTTTQLTRSQQRALDSVLSSRETEPERVQAAVLATKAKVAKALRVGVPAVVLAEALGVSRARVYQMRDEAAPEKQSD